MAPGCKLFIFILIEITNVVHQDEIGNDESTHGSMFVPIIMGSDKTTVSVATGQNDYYPLYASIGNIRNATRRAHRDGLVLVGFFAIPKCMFHFNPCCFSVLTPLPGSRSEADSETFRTFRRQLLQNSLTVILQCFGEHFEVPEVVICSDNHFRRAIYGIGPYIADYQEQVMIAAIVGNWCVR